MDDATQKLVDEARLTLPDDARMQAYYFGFERTGVAAVDAILSAVAVAGKGSHHTEGWSDESEHGYYSDRAGLPANPGGSAVSLIQAAASEAAGLVRSLADALEAAQRPLVSPEVREAMFRLLYDASGSQFMRSNERHSMVTEQRDAILARFSVPSRPPVDPEVQDLVAEARRWAGGSTTSPVGANLVQDLADALEAAQRPLIGHEAREAIRAVVGEQLTKAGLDLNGAPYSDDGETQWPLALELRDCMTAALLARFTIPALDVEKAARCLARADGTDYDVETDGLRMSYDTLAAALVAAIENGELTREETSE